MNNLKFTFLSIFLLMVLVSASLLATDITSIKKGKWNSTATWSGGVIPTAADNVIIGDTVTIDTTDTNPSSVIECNNLTVNRSLKFSQYIGFTISIYGNFTVNSGATCIINTSKTGGVLTQQISLYGNLSNYGQFDIKTGTAGTTQNICHIAFVGSKNDTVMMVGGYMTINNEFGGITINKSGSGRVVLQSDMYLPSGSSNNPAAANPVLTFVRGIVETGSYALIHLWTSSSSMTGASDSSYVLGAMGRGMGNSAGSTKEFFIGDANGYRPLKIRSTTSGNGTGHYAVVRAISGDANTGSSILNGSIDKVSKVRYYKVVYRAVPGGGSSPPWPIMDFDRFSMTYGLHDGVAAGNTHLRIAYSTDERATWNWLGPTNTYTTKLDSLPRYITSDSLIPAITLDTVTSPSTSIYVALARAAGTTENSLDSTSSQVASYQFDLVKGWNMISLPLTITDGSKSTLFPQSPSSAYVYKSPDGYIRMDTLFNRLGYWLKFDSAATTAITGAPLLHDTIPVSAGWNLIGSISETIAVAGIEQNPANNVQSLYYTFTAGYVSSDSILPGKAYWVKTNQAGFLILKSGTVK